MDGCALACFENSADGAKLRVSSSQASSFASVMVFPCCECGETLSKECDTRWSWRLKPRVVLYRPSMPTAPEPGGWGAVGGWVRWQATSDNEVSPKDRPGVQPSREFR